MNSSSHPSARGQTTTMTTTSTGVMSSMISPESGQSGDTGTTTTKVTPHLIHRPSDDPLLSDTEVRPVQLKDMADFMRRSNFGLECITQAQIERVRQMHDRFAEGAALSFNYNTLLLVASVLAGLGLAANSSTTVIASMLVSPIMGPVVGVAYGRTIGDKQLVYQSLKTELLSLIFCIAVGAFVGLSLGNTKMSYRWPNQEMVARGTMENFLVGLPIAFFSGLGVAVSLLDEQVNSLVGVAISASLLPPAVNAGILWVAYGFFENNRHEDHYDVGDYDLEYILSVTRQDFRRAGGISLMLTLANILLVVFASMLMFRLKEKLPIKKKVFWEDLRVARLIYQDRAMLAVERTEEEDEQQQKSESAATLPETHDLPGPMLDTTFEEEGIEGA